MSFVDDGIKYKGKVTALHDTYVVILVGDDEWEIETDDVKAL